MSGILETGRLTLRKLRPEDIPAVVALWTDPEVTHHLGGPRDPEKVTASLQEDAAAGHPYEYDLWPTFEKATGALVGHCGLLEKEVDGKAEIEVVYVIARARWGEGLATEAARALVAYARDVKGIDRLIALIEPDNAASERVAEKAGLRFEREILRPGGAVRRLHAGTAP